MILKQNEGSVRKAQSRCVWLGQALGYEEPCVHLTTASAVYIYVHWVSFASRLHFWLLHTLRKDCQENSLTSLTKNGKSSHQPRIRGACGQHWPRESYLVSHLDAPLLRKDWMILPFIFTQGSFRILDIQSTLTPSQVQLSQRKGASEFLIRPLCLLESPPLGCQWNLFYLWQ